MATLQEALENEAREIRETFASRRRSDSTGSALSSTSISAPAPSSSTSTTTVASPATNNASHAAAAVAAAAPAAPASSYQFANSTSPSAVTTLQDALEEEARELRASFQNRKRTQSGNSFSQPTAPSSPVLRRPNAMSSVYGGGARIALPGDLGPNDPRRKDDHHGGNRVSARSLSPRSGSHSIATGKVPLSQRRLSDAVTRPPRKAIAASQSDTEAPDGGVRLRKDYDAQPDSSSSSSDSEQDDDGGGGGASVRTGIGRGRSRVGNAVGAVQDSEDDTPARGRKSTPDGRDRDSAVDPAITVTPPSSSHGDPTHSRRSDVHPSTAFDFAVSTASTPVHSDDEEHLSDLRRAQRLPLTLSPIHSTPSVHRVIRQIIRGDYAAFQRQAEEGRRRQRVYLVATDLSSEAEYALEWTIGTVLRDGDTLLAVYAVDEEAASSEGGSAGVEIGHGADVVKDTANIVGSLTADSVSQGRLPRDSSTARVAYGEKEGMSRAERERFRAAENISQRCVKLLRKTRLQVRVVVEVFHCKSPRHMITEVVSLFPSIL